MVKAYDDYSKGAFISGFIEGYKAKNRESYEMEERVKAAMELLEKYSTNPLDRL